MLYLENKHTIQTLSSHIVSLSTVGELKTVQLALRLTWKKARMDLNVKSLLPTLADVQIDKRD